LDVIHVEKNVFDNISNTIINVKRKTKDNMKARMNLDLYYGKRNMKFVNDRLRVAKPKTTFVLNNDA
jgi:hypothetical protein